MGKMKLKMSFLAEPSDANYRGNVHGGKVMKWIDEVGYALSVQYAGKYCVTKFVEFLEPIHIGDLVLLDAKITKVGKTSIRIHVNVSSENLIDKIKKQNCACDIVFVAIDEDGKKSKI